MPFTTDLNEFKEEQTKRVPKYFSTNKSKLIGFETRQKFIQWHMNEINIKNAKCHYCNTSILDIRRLLNAGIIKGRSVSNGGLRGPNLEIDRMDPNGGYNERNCVLSCYYCNNDKSNTFNYETYLNIIGPQKGIAWQNLLLQFESNL